jgi:hypothetical protein
MVRDCGIRNWDGMFYSALVRTDVLNCERDMIPETNQKFEKIYAKKRLFVTRNANGVRKRDQKSDRHQVTSPP